MILGFIHLIAETAIRRDRKKYIKKDECEKE
jgi:hypothetical protein